MLISERPCDLSGLTKLTFRTLAWTAGTDVFFLTLKWTRRPLVPTAAKVILALWIEPISIEALPVCGRAKRQKELVPEDEDMSELLNQPNLKLSYMNQSFLFTVRGFFCYLPGEHNPNQKLDLSIKENHQFMTQKGPRLETLHTS